MERPYWAWQYFKESIITIFCDDLENTSTHPTVVTVISKPD